MITVTLSKEELEMIDGWYHVSAGESAHDFTEDMRVLLGKLNIEPDDMDLLGDK